MFGIVQYLKINTHTQHNGTVKNENWMSIQVEQCLNPAIVGFFLLFRREEKRIIITVTKVQMIFIDSISPNYIPPQNLVLQIIVAILKSFCYSVWHVVCTWIYNFNSYRFFMIWPKIDCNVEIQVVFHIFFFIVWNCGKCFACDVNQLLMSYAFRI